MSYIEELIRVLDWLKTGQANPNYVFSHVVLAERIEEGYRFLVLCNIDNMGGVNSIRQKVIDISDALFDFVGIHKPICVEMGLNHGRFIGCKRSDFFEANNFGVMLDNEIRKEIIDDVLHTL